MYHGGMRPGNTEVGSTNLHEGISSIHSIYTYRYTLMVVMLSPYWYSGYWCWVKMGVRMSTGGGPGEDKCYIEVQYGGYVHPLKGISYTLLTACTLYSSIMVGGCIL